MIGKTGMLGTGRRKGWSISALVEKSSFTPVVSNPTRLFFKPDGTQMFVGHNFPGTPDGTGTIYEYSLPTPWSLSNASVVRYLSMSDSFVGGLFFKPDGTRMYVDVGVTKEYALSSAWNISTATYSRASNYSPSESCHFQPDGSAFFSVTGEATTITVSRHALSQAWNVSTNASPQSVAFSRPVTNYGNQISAVAFRPNGLEMFIASFFGKYLQKFVLSSAWNITTASLKNTVFFESANFYPQGMVFRDDGLRMYLTEGFSGKAVEFGIV
jgi:hypothetical protein